MGPVSKRCIPPFDSRLATVVALALLLFLGLWMRPSVAEPLDVSPLSTTTAPENSPAVQPSDATPVRVSVLDLLGKIAFAVLLAYGASFALSRYRLRSSQPGSRRLRLSTRETDHMRVRDALALPGQEGTLYLVEMEGRTLLIGATGQQITVTWPPAAPEDTSTFMPQGPAVGEPTLEVLPEVAGSVASRPRHVPAPARPVRNQTEWAHERRRLINALMRAE
ncbi:MAG: FliO/MopB family protein [Armatimonadetes bacterium]|nr:FliO/MopB family protein [Armatimonadota bacterium]